MKALYTAEVTATGDGRDGKVRSADGLVDLDLAVPVELGGAGGAANPELLFAAGYAACFHSALRLVARPARADVSGSEVTARVGIGFAGESGFGLAVTLRIALPSVNRATAEQLVAQAHDVCPYSRATRGNIELKLELL